MKKRFSFICLALLCSLACAPLSLLSLLEIPLAGASTGLTDGQVVYVSAYPQIYVGKKEQPFYLSINLNIRNIDFTRPITITGIDYHETEGGLLKRFISSPLRLEALKSARYYISDKERAGGPGAYFLIRWKAAVPVNPPVVEALMVGTQSQQGISFSFAGRAVQ